jgi:hypothetical protein
MIVSSIVEQTENTTQMEVTVEQSTSTTTVSPSLIDNYKQLLLKGISQETTFSTSLIDLQNQYSISLEEIQNSKKELKSYWEEYITSLVTPSTVEDSYESDNEEDPVFKLVSPEFKKEYGRIVWVRTTTIIYYIESINNCNI